MDIDIIIRDPTLTESSSLSELAFEHARCGPMTSRRDVVNNHRELKCACGLEVIFRHGSDAGAIVARTAVDGECRELPADTVWAAPHGTVRVFLNEVQSGVSGFAFTDDERASHAAMSVLSTDMAGREVLAGLDVDETAWYVTHQRQFIQRRDHSRESKLRFRELHEKHEKARLQVLGAGIQFRTGDHKLQ